MRRLAGNFCGDRYVEELSASYCRLPSTPSVTLSPVETNILRSRKFKLAGELEKEYRTKRDLHLLCLSGSQKEIVSNAFLPPAICSFSLSRDRLS